jgi:hypothetical protein
MSDFAIGGATRFATYGVDTGTSLAVDVAAHASANTKGSYVEIASSTAFAAQGIIVSIGKTNTSARFLLDIAIGASSSEQVIIPNLIARAENAVQVTGQLFFPIAIPAGSRISARCQSSPGGAAIRVAATICGGGFGNYPVYSGVEAIGISTANTDGSFYQTSGTAINTKCAWQQMTAATSHDIKAIQIAHTHFNSAVVSATLYDIGIGGSGSETVLIPNLAEVVDSGMQSLTNYSACIPCAIPQGTRVSFRQQSSAVNANYFFIIAIYGFY